MMTSGSENAKPKPYIRLPVVQGSQTCNHSFLHRYHFSIAFLTSIVSFGIMHPEQGHQSPRVSMTGEDVAPH